MMATATILLIMQKPGNVRVMQQALGQIGYSGRGVSSEAELQAALAEPKPPRLAVVDVTELGPCIWPTCARLQDHGLAFIVLSTPQALTLANRSLVYGATTSWRPSGGKNLSVCP